MSRASKRERRGNVRGTTQGNATDVATIPVGSREGTRKFGINVPIIASVARDVREGDALDIQTTLRQLQGREGTYAGDAWNDKGKRRSEGKRLRGMMRRRGYFISKGGMIV